MITGRMRNLTEPHCLGKPSDTGRAGGDDRLFTEAVLWIARSDKTDGSSNAIIDVASAIINAG